MKATHQSNFTLALTAITINAQRYPVPSKVLEWNSFLSSQTSIVLLSQLEDNSNTYVTLLQLHVRRRQPRQYTMYASKQRKATEDALHGGTVGRFLKKNY